MGADALGQKSDLKVRAFFGLPLPEAHRDALDRYLATCAEAAPRFRWTPAANLHLTLRFLGQVDQGSAEGIVDRLAGHDLRAFELQLGAPGTFKRGRLVRVVWLGLAAGGDDLGALAQVVERETVAAGMTPETRPFSAHLTLARARSREGAPLPDLVSPPELPAWRAEALVLYRSHLGRAGSVYEPLRKLTLR